MSECTSRWFRDSVVTHHVHRRKLLRDAREVMGLNWDLKPGAEQGGFSSWESTHVPNLPHGVRSTSDPPGGGRGSGRQLPFWTQAHADADHRGPDAPGLMKSALPARQMSCWGYKDDTCGEKDETGLPSIP